ncbi:MAG TPA: hypothetical protein VGE20_19360 [Ramlibacter sp.]
MSAIKLLTATALWLLISSSPAQVPPSATSPSGRKVLTINELFAQSKQMGLEDAAVRSAPTIVFVPGILGSKLKFEDYEFGRDPVNARRLVFDPDRKPIPGTLNDFVIGRLAGGVLDRFSRQDVYGDSLDQMQRLNSGKAVEEFSYDWRADIDDSAREFDEWLRQRGLAKKPVVFLAHSMGGLLVWRWLQLYRKGRATEPVVRQVVLVGSPLQGTCEAARMLIDGYRAPPSGGTFESAVTKYLFDDAHAALLTYPSVYQLLPKYSPKSPCLAYQQKDGTEDPQDHHEPDFWMGRRGGREGLLITDSVLWPRLVKAAGLPDAVYERRIREAIAAGSRFRRSFQWIPPADVQISYLASSDERMGYGFRIDFDRSTTWYRVISAVQDGLRGDGRVLTSSAFNAGTPHALNIARYPVGGTHGALLKHPSFLAVMRPNVMPLIQEQFAVLVGNSLKGDLGAKFARMKIIVDPALPGRVLSGEAMKARYYIADFNARSLFPSAARPAQALVTLGLFKSHGADAERYKAALLESAVVLDSNAFPQRGYLALKNSRSALGESELFEDTIRRVPGTSDSGRTDYFMPPPTQQPSDQPYTQGEQLRN